MANIKSIGGNPIVLDASGIAAGAVTPDKLADMDGITAGAALGITGEATDSAAWLARTSDADGVVTIRSIHGNTVVQDGALVPVNMTGIETVGFNQWDEEWEVGSLDSSGQPDTSTSGIRSKNFIPVLPSTAYYIAGLTSGELRPFYYDGAKAFVSIGYWTDGTANNPFTIPSTARYMKFAMASSYGTTYNHDICINLSDPARNGTYEPYWSSQRTIPASTYFPDGMRSAGSVYDELTESEAITRVGVMDLGSLTWISGPTDTSGKYRMVSTDLSGVIRKPANYLVPADIEIIDYSNTGNEKTYQCVDKSIGVLSTGNLAIYDEQYNQQSSVDAFKTAMSGVMLHYALATPTVTPIDPPLNLTYRTEQGGTERVMVPTGELSAPPTLVAAQGYTAESLRDAALSDIAPVENGKASANYGIGSYLVHGGQLCKVTTAIATGEAIAIGTNVTATTVMAEVIALIAQ